MDSAFRQSPSATSKDALIRLRKNKASVVAFYIILVISSLAIFGQVSTHMRSSQQNLEDQYASQGTRPEKLGIMDGTTILRNRRLDSVKDPNQFPEGSVIRVFNQRTVRGVEMVDVKVDYYKLVGAEDEYYWLGTDYLGQDLWTRLCGVPGYL